jgi:DNA polymerase-3 subunit epsilon
MLLMERAADYLRAGPADSRSLVAAVCQLSALPDLVADHMAASLLGGHPRFSRAIDGRWRLSECTAPAWRVHAPSEEPLLSSLTFAVVDVETTGSRPDGGDRITEIAVVTVRDGRIANVYETLVNPERSIPPFITRLTNISWEMVAEKAPFRDVCDEVLRILEGHVFVAHNAAFDWRFVSAEVRRARGREPTGRRLCTVRLARRLLPQLRSRSLDWVARHYAVEIEPGKRHRGGRCPCHGALSHPPAGRRPSARLRALVRPRASARRRQNGAQAARTASVGHASAGGPGHDGVSRSR